MPSPACTWTPIPTDPALPIFTPDDLMSGHLPQGKRVALYDDDHFYMGSVPAELLVAQGCTQIPYLIRIKRMPRFRFKSTDTGAGRILKLMLPAIFGVSIGQISLLINTIFASLLVTGSVSWLYYADRLMEFPAGLLGVALGTILLPSLSRHYASRSNEAYSRLLDWGLRLTVLLTLPAAFALALLGTPLITTLFHYGAFTAEDVWMTRQALIAYSFGLLGLIMVKVLAPGFYAH